MCCFQRSVIYTILVPLLSGCGARLGQVHGKITFQGRPVPAGTITFAPKGDAFDVGKPAIGSPNKDGEFQLSTFAKHDGALVGPHIVMYAPPVVSSAGDPAIRAAENKLHALFGKCRLPKDHVFEVKPGRNEVTLELTR
jgi:hypothetical protein